MQRQTLNRLKAQIRFWPIRMFLTLEKSNIIAIAIHSIKTKYRLLAFRFPSVVLLSRRF